MKTTIYRIQDENGRGPFNPGQKETWSIMRPDLDNLKPWPLEFGTAGIFYRASGMLCHTGCLTIAQLRRWFIPREYRTLVKRGYNAVELVDCEVLASSDIQCVFARKEPLNVGAKAFDLY